MNERRMRRWLEAEGHTQEEIEDRIDSEANQSVSEGLMLAAEHLVRRAENVGHNVTIERVSVPPWAMGRHKVVVNVWPLRDTAPAGVWLMQTSKPEEPAT